MKYSILREEGYTNILKLIISQLNNWKGWISFFLQAVIEHSKKNILKAKKIIELYEQSKQRITEITRSRSSIKIIDSLLRKPLILLGHLDTFCCAKLLDVRASSSEAYREASFLLALLKNFLWGNFLDSPL